MTIRNKQAVRAAYLRHAVLTDSMEALELTAAELCLSVEEVEAVVNEETSDA